jgi:hypothetical protein
MLKPAFLTLLFFCLPQHTNTAPKQAQSLAPNLDLHIDLSGISDRDYDISTHLYPDNKGAMIAVKIKKSDNCIQCCVPKINVTEKITISMLLQNTRNICSDRESIRFLRNFIKYTDCLKLLDIRELEHNLEIIFLEMISEKSGCYNFTINFFETLQSKKVETFGCQDQAKKTLHFELTNSTENPFLLITVTHKNGKKN